MWEFELEEGDLDGGIGIDGEEEPLEETERYAELTLDPALERRGKEMREESDLRVLSRLLLRQ